MVNNMKNSEVGSDPDHYNADVTATKRFGAVEKPSSSLEQPIPEVLSSIRKDSSLQVPPSTSEKLLSVAKELIPEDPPTILEEPLSIAEEPNSEELPSIPETPHRIPEKENAVLEMNKMAEMIFNQVDELNGGLASFRSLDLGPSEPEVVVGLRPAHSVDSSHTLSAPKRSLPLLKEFAIMLKTSPELMNLIDSAIRGSDRVSLVKLKRVVGGEEVFGSRDGDDDANLARFVVDTLIAKMGGADGLDKVSEVSASRMMLSAGAAAVAGELLPWIPCEDDKTIMSPRTRMAKALSLILRACTRNRAMCSAAGLLRVLLVAYQRIVMGTVGRRKGSESWNTGALLDAIEALGSHCVSVKHLREWLSAVANISSTGKPAALDLLHTLERSMSGEETRGPAYSFEFDGESSGLLSPGESKWPFLNGYAFATWLYIESFADTVDTAATAAAIASAAAAKTGNSSAMSAAAAASALATEGTAHMPRLFSFLSVDNLGVEAYFHGQFLVVESIHGKGKKASLHFTHAFKPKRWYFVGIEHTHKQSLLGKAEDEMKLYVDGSLYESRALVFPRLSRGLGFCCIGKNPSPVVVGLQKCRRQCPLFAEMGPVYIFKEPLGEKKMLRLALRGGDALPTFGAAAGAPWLANNEQAAAAAEESAALDLELGPRLHLLYHPKLLNGRSCPDSSPTGASAAHKKPAEVLGHVHIAARVRPMEAVWAVGEGGPMTLLPLAVGAVDKDSIQPVIKGEVSSSSALLAAPIFRMLALGLKSSGIAEEFARTHADRVMASLLGYLVRVPSFVGHEKKVDEQAKTEERDEELVAAVVSLAQAPQCHNSLKVQLFSSLLLDLKLWSSCSYGLQKKLLSTLADMVYSEAATMRGANAVQMLLDGCRRCYWLYPEPNSLFTFAVEKSTRHDGELNALVDELLVVVELLVGSAQGTALSDDVCSLVQFVLDCPQPNQVARVLHLIYRLVIQPNSTKATAFAVTFLANGGAEMLFTLLRREAESGEGSSNGSIKDADPEMIGPCDDKQVTKGPEDVEVPSDVNADYEVMNSTREMQGISTFLSSESAGTSDGSKGISENDLQLPLSTKDVVSVARSRSAAHKASTAGTLGGISSSISADSVRNKFRNVDFSDSIMVGIVTLLGSLVSGGHLKVVRFGMAVSQPSSSSADPGVSSSGEGTAGVAAAAVVWLLFALEKAFQSAPRKLLTVNVYAALLPAVIRSENGPLLADDRLAFYDAGHRFENIPLLLVLLRTLPLATVQLQLRVLQDMLLLACTHPENRTLLTKMPEWPEWLLEILLSNYEASGMGSSEGNDKSEEIEDLVYSFLTIMLEHSLRLKDGWKDVEATIHCAEWLILTGGSSTGERRFKREMYLPILKRKIFCSLLSFASNELQLQTQVVAASAAGVAAGGLSPRTAKAEAETVATLSVSLSENALVLLMLVEDHLRLESQAYQSTLMTKSGAPGRSTYAISRSSLSGRMDSFGSRSFALSFDALDSSLEKPLSGESSNSEMGNLSPEALAITSDENAKISATTMERLSASVAAEPYESVRCAFACYGSYGLELALGWKRRSRMWYGVGLPPKTNLLGGGGGGFKVWSSGLEKNAEGQWVDLELVKKAVTMLKALLLDQYGPGTGVGGIFVSGPAGSGSWGLQLPQLLDSDQPFFAMLRITLLALREEDQGEPIFEGASTEHDKNIETMLPSVRRRSKTSSGQWNIGSDYFQELATSNARGSLLWRVLAPLLTMQLFESRRQRVLVACCILYSEMWHSVSEDRDVLRQRYMETIIPPFAALLRRWRPLLSGIHELTDAQGQSPLVVEYHHLAPDMHPLEAGLAMISPAWAAAFASPPAAMALAMAAAGVGGGEGSHRRRNSESDRRSPKLSSFPTFSKAPDRVEVLQTPADIAASKAAALAAARDQDRAARIGSGRGLGAVAMATAVLRRSLTDKERAERRNIWEAMSNMWLDSGSVGYSVEKNPSGHPRRMFEMISSMSENARKIRSAEVDRREKIAATDEFDATLGDRAWRSLLRRLEETDALFGTFCNQIGPGPRIFWKLDFTENSLRMRLRLKQSYKGTDHHGAAVDHQESEKPSISHALGRIPLPEEAPKLVPEKDALEDSNEEDLREQKQHLEERSGKVDMDPASETVVEDAMIRVSVPAQTTNATDVSEVAAAMPTEREENSILEIPAVMILPLKFLNGSFQVTTKRICFMIDNCVYINESGVASMLDAEDGWKTVRDEAEEHYGARCERKDSGKHRSWPLSRLREVHRRRFALKTSALELFMMDRSNVFFNFETVNARQRVYKAIVLAKPPYLDSIYARAQGPEQLLKNSNLTERWARREITNFEYLMQLNTLAGRTYNDMTQHPVFPWVLADYTSEELNLDDPNVFRDLSKPVGALNPARLQKFLESYDNFDDPVIPKFHYHSHYSSAGTVLYYLVRVEPYTSLAIQLKGGKFDNADRMFSDIGLTWNRVLEDMSDVKELIPELFYLPEALKNRNRIDFGRTLRGDNLGDVKLPPWASSPEEFIFKHRSALESEHVSEHLNEWIDLIFGCKQRGQAAISANNVFFYMTYEGAVDIDKITDPMLRKATQDQCTHFGQTPSQLLTTPHVKRMPLADILHLQTIFRNPNSTKAYAIPSPDRLNLPAKELRTTHDSLITVDMETPACHVAVQKWQPNTPDGRGLPFLFHHGRSNIGQSSGLMRMFSRPTDDEENRFPRAVALPPPGVRLGSIVAITPDGRFLLTGGHADNSVKLVATDTAHAVESASSHCAPVTCLGLSPDGSILVTGSQDSTALIWRFHGGSASYTSAGSTGLSDPPQVAASASAAGGASNLGGNITADSRRPCLEGPLHVLRGHVDELVSCCVNADLDLVVTFSSSKGVLLHSISKGRFLRRLSVDRADLVALSPEGIIVVFDKATRVLQSYTVNGTLMAAKLLPSWEGNISCIVISKDGLHAALGTSCLLPDGSRPTPRRTVVDSEAERYGGQHSPKWSVVGACPSCGGKSKMHSVNCKFLRGNQQPPSQGNQHPGFDSLPRNPSRYPRSDASIVMRRSESGLIRYTSSDMRRSKEAGGLGSGDMGISTEFLQRQHIEPQPAIILLELYTLEVIQKFMLRRGQDITAMTLNSDNSNLVVSTAEKHLLVFTDPALSMKVVNQMLRMGSEGGGLAGYI